MKSPSFLVTLFFGLVLSSLPAFAATGGRSLSTAPVTLFASAGVHPLTGYLIRTMVTVTNIGTVEQNVRAHVLDLNPTFVLNRTSAYSPPNASSITGSWAFNGVNANTFTVATANVLNPPSKYTVPNTPGESYFTIPAGRSLIFGFNLACVPEASSFSCDNSEASAFGGSHTPISNLGGSLTAVERFAIDVREDRGALVANAYVYLSVAGVTDVVGTADSINQALNGGRPF